MFASARVEVVFRLVLIIITCLGFFYIRQIQVDLFTEPDRVLKSLISFSLIRGLPTT